MKRDEIIGGIILFLFGGITILLSLQMPIGTFRAAGTGLFPPDADSFREKAEPAVEGLFKTEWPVTTWKEILAQ